MRFGKVFPPCGKIHPVEVKSGATGSLRSLHLFLTTYPECGNALIFSDRPYADLPEQRITFLPLYGAFAATGGHMYKVLGWWSVIGRWD